MSAEPAGPATAGSAPADGWAWPSSALPPVVLPAAAALAAAVLALTGTGSATVAAVLLGLAVADRRTGAAAVLAVLAAGVRFRTDAFDDLAGIQSVLGIAGEVGPATAAASAWASAAAVVLAVRPLARAGDNRWLRLVPAVPAGLLAAALAAGPGPDDLGIRLLASAVAVALAAGVGLVTQADQRVRDALPWAGVVTGIAAVVLAGWPA